MPDIRIYKKGVQKLLKDLNPHKSTGPDEVPSRILKIGAEELSPALVKLYQHSIDVGEVPQEWRDANVVPIFKKGDRCQSSNCRPVSLSSVVCKVLEHIVHGNIIVIKGEKIRSRYNQVPHPTQDTNGKFTNSQLDTINESQEVLITTDGIYSATVNMVSENAVRVRPSLLKLSMT